MKKAVLVAGFPGALAVYTWIFIAHMFLPLGEAGIQQINNEEALLASMKTTLPAHGMYMFPKLENPAEMAESEKKIAAGPSVSSPTSRHEASNSAKC